MTSHSEQETIDFGVAFAKQLKPGDTVALYGELGTGKTRFVQGVCKGLGVREHVASPTFTIVNEYQGAGVTVYHFDFYRVNTAIEIRDVGFIEYTNGGGVCLIEWAEKAWALLPPSRYDVRMSLGENDHTRELAVEQLLEVQT